MTQMTSTWGSLLTSILFFAVARILTRLILGDALHFEQIWASLISGVFGGTLTWLLVLHRQRKFAEKQRLRAGDQSPAVSSN